MKILFVEDSRGIQLMYEQLLRKLALEVEPLWASNVDDGIAMTRDNPDLAIVVVDNNLGEKSGLEFVKTIRPQFQGKIIAASSYRGACETLMEAGADFSCDGDKGRVGDLIKDIIAATGQ